MKMNSDAARRRILITGASGTIGRRLVCSLTEGGHEVFGLVRSSRSAETVERLGGTAVFGDILNPDGVADVVRATRPEIVIHQATALAAVNPRRMRSSMRTTNRIRAEGTKSLVAAAERFGVQRLIAQSIAFGYRHEGPRVLDESAPLDTQAGGGWGEAMRAIAALERAVMDAQQVQGVVLRYGGFYGPDTAVAPDGLVGRLLRDRRLPVIGDGAGLNPFIHIDDAVGATLDAIERGWGVYNIVDERSLPAREWIPTAARVFGAPPPRHVPAWFARPLAGSQAVRVMTTQRGASNAKAKGELGWRPEFADFEAGLSPMTAHEPVSAEL